MIKSGKDMNIERQQIVRCIYLNGRRGAEADVRERERERERQTDRQTDRQRQTHREHRRVICLIVARESVSNESSMFSGEGVNRNAEV